MRIHNSARHALASCLSSFGVHTSEEVAVPAWARKDAQGRWHEAILDVEARVPGSTVATRVDVTIVATQSSKHKRTWPTVALGAADSAKVKRYGTGVAPLAVALRGRWSPAALQTLELLAGAASSTSGVPAIRVQRRLQLRAPALVQALEALRAHVLDPSRKDTFPRIIVVTEALRPSPVPLHPISHDS